jgi:hypothetical protein
MGRGWRVGGGAAGVGWGGGEGGAGWAHLGRGCVMHTNNLLGVLNTDINLDASLLLKGAQA